MFGTCGTIKENPSGGFSFEMPGGGGIHIDNGSGFERLKKMEDEMAQTGHIPPHLWGAAGLYPQVPASNLMNSGPAVWGQNMFAAAQASKGGRPDSMGKGSPPMFQKGFAGKGN